MRTVLGLGLGGLLLAGAALAQDVEAGWKVANMCRTCHGLDGIARIPVAPNIGGEPADYLAAQLRNFRSGARQQEMMSVVAAGLNDGQIADVTAFYAAQDVVAVPAPGSDLTGAPELCADCHGADGIAVIPEAPNLAGESTIYLDTQLKAFRAGKRQSEIMARSRPNSTIRRSGLPPSGTRRSASSPAAADGARAPTPIAAVTASV